ncbi:uncharacterized protein LOC121267756 [Juglans microcarpa x Juglans regia]|uniref:uncharacterized protein LOC121267756 n=1 Tax=Juglans microcarpa x Juglans regia TaxID=2249226 RepID=UPI001B7F07AF|nr:uncharacterized protein LOC121267756 [Juglans microcarpa x Juglans regia]
MDDSTALKPVPLPLRSSALRLGNSIATPVQLPVKLSLPNSTAKPLHCSNSFPYQNGIAPVLNFELLSSLKSSQAYTSLKDLLPSSSAAVGSPTVASAANSSYEVSIRNRLVKQAAWAYLQPMSSSPGSSGSHFLSRLCLRLSSCLTDCLDFIKSHLVPAATRLLDQILRAFGLRNSR